MRTLYSIFLLSIICLSADASLSVVDDAGRIIELPRSAERIVSLSPHATELLFAAGATTQVVGTMEYSDFPEQAKAIPRIGSFQKIDLERVIALKPDVVVGWRAGGTYQQQLTLLELGIPVFFSEPESFAAVAANIRAFGKLLGTEDSAEESATQFEVELSKLRQTYSGRKEISVFYQVWKDPLITINGEHLITRVIEFCGGRNLFADLALRAPKISLESVIAADPQVVIVGVNENRSEWVADWYRWQDMRAVRQGHIYAVQADLIVRQSPRVLLGARQLCEQLEKVRRSS